MTYFVGVKYLDYFSKKSNRQITGYSVHFVTENPSFVGYETFNHFVACSTYDKHFSQLPLNSSVNLQYDRFNNLVGATVEERSK